MPLEIVDKVKIDEIRLASLLAELIDSKHIGGSNNHYYLTAKGVNAYTGKEFLNKMWYRSIHTWISILTVVISVVALIVSLKSDK